MEETINEAKWTDSLRGVSIGIGCRGIYANTRERKFK